MIKGYDGTLFTRAEVDRFINSIPDAQLAWAKFLVVHNTGAPNMHQEDATPDRNKDGTGEDDRMRNAKTGYAKWNGRGPSFWVFNSGHYGLGTPLPEWGVHSPSWNRTSIGVEMVADFRPGVDNPYAGGGLVITDSTAYLFASLLKKLKLPCNGTTIRLHKEDKATTHDCPGKLFNKQDFLTRVQAYMGGSVSVPSVPENPAPAVRWTNTPDDTLNLRFEPAGRIKGSLPHATRVEVFGTDASWSRIKTPGGYTGWVASRYLAPLKPAVGPNVRPSDPILPPPIPETPGEATMPPGSYRYSPFCVEWAKRFEGKGVPGKPFQAYWDVNDWAIGYGHNNGSGVKPAVHEGMKITEAEANAILESDLNLQLRYLEAYCDVPLTQGWVDALCLHIFQQGPGNFREGKVRPLLNAGKFKEAAAAIKNWPTSKDGLKRRRAIEAEIALGGKPTKW